jgi:hypothetical protein
MDFVRTWWLYLVLAGILLVLLIVDLTVTAGYQHETRMAVRRLTDLAQEARTQSAKLSALPTEGDIRQVRERIDALEQEGAKAVESWKASTAMMDQEHGVSPGDFSLHLYRKCNAMVQRTAVDVSRIHGLSEERIEEELESEDPEGAIIWISDPQQQQLADLTVDYRTLEQTTLPWKKYLISSAIHRVAGQTSVRVEVDRLVVDEEGQYLTNEENVPMTEPAEQVRTLDKLGKITIEAPTEASFGGSGEEAMGRYEVYDVSFEVIGHLRAIQQFNQALLSYEGMLFEPASRSDERFDESQVRPDSTRSVPEARRAQLGSVPTPPLLDLLPDHEPPIRSKLSYRVYHFQTFGAEQEQSD